VPGVAISWKRVGWAAGHAYTQPKDAKHRKLVLRCALDAVYQQTNHHQFQLITQPIRLTIECAFPPPKTPKYHREACERGEVAFLSPPDCSNLAKNVEDSMNGQIYADDAQIVSLNVTKRYCRAGEGPHTRILIEILT